MTEVLERLPLSLICVGLLCVLGLRRLVRMEGHHELRVAILTGLLWVPVIYLFIVTYLPSCPRCASSPGDPDAYSCILK